MSENAIKSEIMTVAEVMKMLRVSRSTIYKLLNSGQLKSFSPGGTRCRRIRRADLESYIESEISAN
jgi:excisionase family DNA binding protein